MNKGDIEDDFVDEKEDNPNDKQNDDKKSESAKSSSRKEENGDQKNLNSTISSVISSVLGSDKPEDILSDNAAEDESNVKNEDSEAAKESENSKPKLGLQSIIRDKLSKDSLKDEQNQESEKNEQINAKEKELKVTKENDSHVEESDKDDKDKKEVQEKTENQDTSKTEDSVDGIFSASEDSDHHKSESKETSDDKQENKETSDKEEKKESEEGEIIRIPQTESEELSLSTLIQDKLNESKEQMDKEKKESEDGTKVTDKELKSEEGNNENENEGKHSSKDDSDAKHSGKDSKKKEYPKENSDEKGEEESEYEEEEEEYEEEESEDGKNKDGADPKLAISESISPNVERADDNNENNDENNDEENEDSVMVTAVKSNSKIPAFIPPQPQFSDEELASAYKKLFLKKPIIPPPEMRPALIEYGRKQSVQHTILEEYDAAQADDDAVNLLLQCVSDYNKTNASDNEKENIKNRLDEVDREKKAVEDRFKEEMKQMDQQRQMEFDKLLHEQEEERRKFEERWSNEDAVLPFSKPSSQLLQIRRMQKAMALAHHFPKAKQLKMQGDQLQKEEAQIASKNAADVMRQQYLLLLDKQEKQRDCFQKNYDRKRTVKECAKDAELNSLENTRKQLLTRSTTRIKRPTVTIPLVTRDGRGSGSGGLVTQRTRTQYATYKKSAEKSKLDVKPLDVKSIIRPLTPSPRKAQTQRLK